MLGDWLSFLSGFSLLIIGSCVMIVYWPRKGWRNSSAGLLGMAIWLGFFAAVLNTLYWQVMGQSTVEFLHLWSIHDLRFWGDYVDVLVKGGAAFAGLLHLMALKKKEAEKG